MAEEKYLLEELTHKIIGCAYRVFNELGSGYKEKYYQKAMEVALEEVGLIFQKENYCSVKFKNVRVGYVRLDYLINDLVIVELKARDDVYKVDIAQILNYLKVKNLRLGLLILFGKEKVKIKRVIN